MTIDERLERLTERHEALTQTVEIIAGMQRENEALHQKNEILLAHVMESIDSLARIAHAHEQRISDIEDRRE
jgi:archaellum component FlaC